VSAQTTPQSPRRALNELPLLASAPVPTEDPGRAPDLSALPTGYTGPHARVAGEDIQPHALTHTPAFWREVDALTARVSAAMVQQSDQTLTMDEASQRELGRSLLESHMLEHQQALAREGQPRWSSGYATELKRAVMAALFGLGRLQPLVDDPQVENVEITGHDQVLVFYADGRREWADPVAESDEQLIEYLRFIAARRGASGERAFTQANPMLSLSLPPDLRLQAAAFITPRPKVVIRKDRLASLDLAGLRDLNELDQVLFDFLTAAVRAHKSVVVSGRGQGSGKSTLLRALIGQMDPWESIVTVETEYELRLDQMPERHYRVTSFQARPGTGEVAAGGGEAGEFTVDEVIYGSLRMNADRVVVGEVRGKEVIGMFKAMQMGNGSFSTIHANSARDVVERLVTCAVEDASVTEAYAYRQVFQHIDLIIFLESSYDPQTRRRYRFISQVLEVTAPDAAASVPYAVNELFMPGPDGRAIPTGVMPTFIDDLVREGFDQTLLTTSGSWGPHPLGERP